MKYYVYVSDTKIDMLYAQIPRGIREKIATELKLDLKVASVVLKEKPNEETRYSKVGFVAAYIERHEDIGTVDQTGSYIKDELAMRWGPYAGWDDDPQLVYFGGGTKTTIVGLGGSMHHVLGHTRGESHPHSSSASGSIIAELEKEARAEKDTKTEFPLGLENTLLEDWRKEPNHVHNVLEAVSIATTHMEGPIQRLEFLAKRLLEGKVDPQRFDASNRTLDKSLSRTHVVLGSPIYVALID